MLKNVNIEKIKKIIQNSVGKKCDILAKRGRKKVFFKNCTVDSAYPVIFIIKTDMSKGKSTSISFSYTDILTKNVCIFLHSEVQKDVGA